MYSVYYLINLKELTILNFTFTEQLKYIHLKVTIRSVPGLFAQLLMRLVYRTCVMAARNFMTVIKA